MNILNVYV